MTRVPARPPTGPLPAILLLVLVVGGAQATQCLITVNTTDTDQVNPAISGELVAWEDATEGSIHLYDIATGTETRVSPSAPSQFHPALGGSLLAWEEVNDWAALNITFRDPAGGTSVHLSTNGAAPAIEGDRILWAEGFPPGALLLYNSMDGTTTTLVSSVDTSIEQPALSGDRIAWVNGSETAIYLKNLTTGDEILITPGLGQVLHPVFSGDRVVWQDLRNFINQDLYLFDLTSGLGTRLTDGPGDNMNPATDGTRLVWVNGTEIYLIDLAGSDPATVVSSGGIMNDMPRISGDRVVWQKFEDDGYYNIYLRTLGSALPCPVAGFDANTTSGGAPLAVQFTDTSSGSPASWLWEFGDGTTSSEENPVHVYAADGTYPVALTVGNTVGRGYTSQADYLQVSLVPVVSFLANQTHGIAPLPVQFTDTSSAEPGTWAWDFGDGETSADKDPVHVFTTPGTYTVSLAATNANGTGTGSMPEPIRVLNGVNLRSTTDIAGLQVTDVAGRQETALDTGAMDGNSFDPAAPGSFSFTPPASSGWRNITFFSDDGIGFALDAGGIIRGNLSSCTLGSSLIIPTTFTTGAGNNLPISYTIDLDSYPVAAEVNATVWEGVIPADDTAFRQTLATRSPQFVSVLDTAYTLSFVTTNLHDVRGATLNLSVSRAWVASNGNQNNITTIRLGDDGNNEVLNPDATFTDGTGTLDFYRVPSPHGLSRFALVSAAGSSNLVQMGIRVATRFIHSSGMGYTSGVSRTAPLTPEETPPTPATSPVPRPAATYYGQWKVDATPAGITRDPVIISPGDRGAGLFIRAGTAARDGTGVPLALVTAGAFPGGSVPPVPPGAGISFTGLAYDFGPDGATFNPPATLSFTIPGELWDPAARYSIMTFSPQAGAWEEIPTTVDPAGRVASGTISHLCLFGLFSGAPAGAVTMAPGERPAGAPTPARPEPVPLTPMGIFTGLLGWIYATAVANLLASLTILFMVLVCLFALTRGGWLARHRPWITLYLASLTGLLWAAFLLASGSPPWEGVFILITVAGLNLIVHLFRFDRIEISLRVPDPLRG